MNKSLDVYVQYIYTDKFNERFLQFPKHCYKNEKKIQTNRETQKPCCGAKRTLKTEK